MIENDNDIFSVLNNYYLFFAARGGNRTVWSEPYIDDFTGRKIVTVASPIYTSNKNGTFQEFLGVAGHDIFLSDFGSDEDAITKRLEAQNLESSKCDLPLTDPCQMQIFRNEFTDGDTCVDRFPIKAAPEKDPQCFTNGKLFYKRFSSLVNWETAKSMCEANGGQLVSVGSDEELEFVASMASDDGTWIGLRQKDSGVFWTNENLSNLSKESKYWGVNQPGSIAGSTDCVTVDPRSPAKNLNLTRCENSFSFICEYKSDKSCKGKVLNPRDQPDGYFTMPPANLCPYTKDIELQNTLEEEANKRNSSDVICPPWKRHSDEETICCDECISEKIEDDKKSKYYYLTIIFAVTIFVLLVVFIGAAQCWFILMRRERPQNGNQSIPARETQQQDSLTEQPNASESLEMNASTISDSRQALNRQESSTLSQSNPSS